MHHAPALLIPPTYDTTSLLARTRGHDATTHAICNTGLTEHVTPPAHHKTTGSNPTRVAVAACNLYPRLVLLLLLFILGVTRDHNNLVCTLPLHSATFVNTPAEFVLVLATPIAVWHVSLPIQVTPPTECLVADADCTGVLPSCIHVPHAIQLVSVGCYLYLR